jgi:hypothetical protein
MSRSRDRYDEVERFARDVDLLLAGQPVAGTSDDAYRADLSLVHLLNRARFVPDPRFKSRLRSHLLHQLYEKEEVKTMSIVKVFRSLVRPALVAGLSAMIVLGVMFAVSPDVRAAAQEWLARFVEVDSPWALLPSAEEQLVAEKQPALPPVPAAPSAETEDRASSGKTVPTSPEGESLTIEELEELSVPDVQPNRELLSLKDAQAGLDFKIRVPSVLPEGYSFLGVMPLPEPPAQTPNTGIEPPADLPKVKPPQVATLLFSNAAGEMLPLSEVRLSGSGPAEVPLPVGGEGVRDVTVNGQPAQYIEGRWTRDGWVSGDHYQLHWQDAEGIMYDLISRTLGLEELLVVAESIE